MTAAVDRRRRLRWERSDQDGQLGDEPSMTSMTTSQTTDDGSLRESLQNARVFIQDSLDRSHDRATIGNLMGARDEIDRALDALLPQAGEAERLTSERDALKLEVAQLKAHVAAILEDGVDGDDY